MSEGTTTEQLKRMLKAPPKKRSRVHRSMPAGDPDFFKEIIAEVVEKTEAGYTDREICQSMGVSTFSLYAWRKMHPELAEASARAKAVADARVVNSLYRKALGYEVVEKQAIKVKVDQYVEQVEIVEVEKHVPPDTTAAIFWLKNRDPARWADRRDVNLSGSLEVSEASDRELALALLQVFQQGLVEAEAEAEPATIEHQPEEPQVSSRRFG